MKKIAILLGTVLLVLGFVSQAWCTTYTATDILNHATPGASVTSGTALSTKTTLNNTIGVGTSTGAVAGEIDNASLAAATDQWIRISFNTPQFVSAFSVAFLYPYGQYGDLVDEMAAIITNSGIQTLQATGFTSATWSGSGSVINLEEAASPNGGVWKVTNPYVNAPISYIEFRAVQLANGGSADSDYSIVSVSTAAVPEPATMLLLGLGLVGLAGIRRMKR